MDVIKTRLQTQSMKGNSQQMVSEETMVDVKYKDIISTTKRIFREEGVLGFTRGAAPRAILSSISTALSWASYELIKGMLVTA